MKYYEITPESPAYEPSVEYWNAPKVWEKADAEIKELLGGYELDDNLIYNAGCLCLKNVPENLKKQFRKHTGSYFPARAKSEINKKFLQIVEKYDLYTRRAINITFTLDLNCGKGGQLYPPMYGRYYITIERNVGNMKGIIEIPEPIFLRLRADWLESKGNKSLSGAEANL